MSVTGAAGFLAAGVTAGLKPSGRPDLALVVNTGPDQVAAAVAGRALDARPINKPGLAAARCVYGLEVDGARRALVLWVNPVGDYDDFRKSATAPVDIRDVGDDAFETTDGETKRVQLTARRRGKVMVQVTADRSAWAQAVAKLALTKF